MKMSDDMKNESGETSTVDENLQISDEEKVESKDDDSSETALPRNRDRATGGSNRPLGLFSQQEESRNRDSIPLTH